MPGPMWPGLFAWSTKYHDGTAPSQFKQMTDEDRKFLEKALEEAFGQIEDPNKVMQEAIEEIKSEERTDATITTALEVIDRCCDDPDCARNAELLGGIQTLMDLLTTHQGDIQVRSLEILALLFSNNQPLQEVGMRRGALPLLARIIREAPKGSDGRLKAFRTLVALVRPLEALEKAFLEEHDGVALLVDLLDRGEDSRAREKAASFVRSLAGVGRLDEEATGRLATATAPLFAGLVDEGLQYRETLASCAYELAALFPTQCQSVLQAPVQARLEEAKDPENEQEAQFLAQCMDALGARGAEAAPAA